jgi:hypothetical protein
MYSWQHFQNRWNRMQSADIGRNTLDITALTADLANLDKFLVYLAAKAALGQPLTIEDPVLRTFLNIGRADNGRKALLEIVANMQHQHKPRVVQCPKCGAGVRDLVGITNERCQFCGITLATND